jgi:hypothetical protein
VNLPLVIFAEIKIQQSPSFQTHRSVAVSKREKVSKREGKKQQSSPGSCQPQTPSTHKIPFDKLGSTKRQSVGKAAL